MKSAHRVSGPIPLNNIFKTSLFISFVLLISILFSACNKSVSGTSGKVPAAPTITGIYGGQGRVIISFNPVNNATFYNIFWAADSTVSPRIGSRKSVIVSPDTVSNLSDSTKYAFVVTAINGFGESKPSAVDTVTTKMPSAAPIINKVVSGYGNITVSWSAASGAKSYNLYWAADSTVTENTGNLISNAKSPTTINGLSAGTEYAFLVTSVGRYKSIPGKVVTALTQPKTYLFVANSGNNNASILSIGEHGFLAPIPNSPAAVGQNPTSVTSADLNGDGMPDFISANSGSNSISVLMNSTGLKFDSQKTFAAGNNPSSVTTADVNNDGKADIIVTNQGSNTVSVLLNTTTTGSSTPSFTDQKTFNTGNGPISVCARDMNNDGKPDLVIGNGIAGTVSILLNTTDPGAASPSFATQQTLTVSGGVSDVTVADINNDGKPDLIVANPNNSTISVFLNTTPAGSSKLSFGTQQTFTVGNGVSSVTTADINGDGKPDVIAANKNDNTISILMNTTSAGNTSVSFAKQRNYDVDIAPVCVKVADVNGDGKPDILVSENQSNDVSVFLNITTPGSSTALFNTEQTYTTGSGPMGIAVGHIGPNRKKAQAVIIPQDAIK